MSNLKKSSVKAFKWNFVGNLLTYGGSFVFSIVLARLLSPEEFGVLGMVMVFVVISQGLVDVGFSSAIIQKQEVTEEQLSTVFYINLILSSGLFIIFWFLAKPIAIFYDVPIVENITRLISLIFIINGIGQVQRSLLIKQLRYNTIAKISVVSVVLSGIIAIYISLEGEGVYALVGQQLSLAFFTNLFFWLNSKWKPRAIFSLRSIKELYDYGIRLFASSILHSAYTRLDTFVIGKVFSATTLGLYSRSLGFKSMVDILSTNGLQVLFPVFSKKQDDIIGLANIFKLLFKTVGIFSIFLSSLLWLVAVPFFLILLGEEWLKSAYYFKIIIITGFVGPLGTVMVNVIKAVGRSDIYLKLEIYKKAVQIPAFIVAFIFSIEAFLWTRTFLMVIAFCINLYFVAQLLKINLGQLFIEISLQAITIIIPGCFTYFLTDGYFDDSLFLQLIMIGSIFSTLALALIFFTQKESLMAIKEKLT